MAIIKVCEMEPRLRLERFRSPVVLKPGTTRPAGQRLT